MNKYLNKSARERAVIVAQNRELQAAITELKRQLSAKPKNSEDFSEQFAAEDKIFLSNQKLEDCRKLYYNGDYQGVIRLCGEVIEINANNANAYALRGEGSMGLCEGQIFEERRLKKIFCRRAIVDKRKCLCYILQAGGERL